MCVVLLFTAEVHALAFPIKDNSDIIGYVDTITVQKGDTFFEIARSFDLGYLELVEANPEVDPNKLIPGTELIIPTAFILPPGPREGIVLNLAELRIYYFTEDGKTVVTHPVGIGRLGWRTPVGESKVVRKKEGPTWIPPDSIRASYARKGKTLPYSIGPGPNNPLGEYAMYLDWPRYLIHGTNQPDSVGKRSSSGCVRMYPEDISNLFQHVPVGTTIRVIHEPFKVGQKDGQLYLEAHEPFTEKYYEADDEEELLEDAVDAAIFPNARVNWDDAHHLINETIGYPMKITVKP